MIPSVNISQANAIEIKASNWVGYLDTLTIELHGHKPDTFYPLRAASLWSSTFAYIEWLVCFYEDKTFPSKSEVAHALKNAWGWNEDLAKLFWGSGRHPFTHVGQANVFHSYGKYGSLDTNVSFDVNSWSSAVTDEWGKHHTYKAVSILPPLKLEDQNLQMISFHHQMMKTELLPALSKFVADSIRNESSEERLKDIIKLNRQILH